MTDTYKKNQQEVTGIFGPLIILRLAIQETRGSRQTARRASAQDDFSF
jgi:hypothetical protein